MSDLLNLAIKAHGGLRRWKTLWPREPRTLHSSPAACKTPAPGRDTLIPAAYDLALGTL
jgi:hypothetical protein